MRELPKPPSYLGDVEEEIYKVDAGSVARSATAWAKQHNIKPAPSDKLKVAVLVIDPQVDFCIPNYGSLYVQDAEKDIKRLCEFIYRNVANITKIFPTLDTHTTGQIFHPQFWVDEQGQHPVPMTFITVEDVTSGKWKVNQAMAWNHNIPYAYLQNHAVHYVKELEKSGRYSLCIWPMHCRLSSIGHAIVPALDEAMLFHNFARNSCTGYEIKGGNPLTENYSVFCPEVTTGPGGNSIDQKNVGFIDTTINYDIIAVAGEAKSHCFAWTIDDILKYIKAKDPELAKKIFLMEDCTSPVIIPGVVDFTDDANKAFERFASEGMNIVKSTDPIMDWPGVADMI